MQRETADPAPISGDYRFIPNQSAIGTRQQAIIVSTAQLRFFEHNFSIGVGIINDRYRDVTDYSDASFCRGLNWPVLSIVLLSTDPDSPSDCYVLL